MQKKKVVITDIYKACKKQTDVLYFFIAVIACCLTTIQLSGQISESLRILCYILLFFSFSGWKGRLGRVYLIFYKKWHRCVLFLLEIYSTFAVTGMYILDSSVEYEMRYPDILYMVLSYVWIRPVVILIMDTLLSINKEGIQKKDSKETIYTRIILICVILLPCAVFLIGFNPAITSPDSEYCWDLARRIGAPDLYIDNWQPPFYVFILSLFIRVCDSVTFVIAAQCIFYAVIFVDGILFFYKIGISKRILAFIYCFTAFGISNIVQLITLWKDIPYLTSMMWLTILLMKYILDREQYANKKGWYIQMIIALIFTAMFRQNGILPALGVIVLLPLIVGEYKKMIMVSIISIGCLLFIKYPLYDAMHVKEVPQLKFFSLANDIMYSYYQGDSVSEEAMEIVNKVTSNDPDHYEYSAYYVKYNNEEPTGYTAAEFIRIYIENMIRNPRDTCMAILMRNSDVWSIARPADEVPGCVNYLGEFNTSPEKLYPFRQTNFLTAAFTKLCGWVTNNSVLFILYWRTGIYNLMILFMIIILMIKRGKYRRFLYILPFLPVCMSILALVISSGWSDYRYFWPGMTISLLLFCYFNVLTDLDHSSAETTADHLN